MASIDLYSQNIYSIFSKRYLKILTIRYPSDFWLFPTMKDILRGRTFTSRAAIASAIFQWSKQTPREAFAAAMESWRRRFKKCVRLQGDYVEKWQKFQIFSMIIV
jgi:hypothetical protein